MHAKLSAELYHTRDSLNKACFALGIKPSLVQPELMAVAQCCNCDIWETLDHIEEDMCLFCNNMDTMRI